MLTCWCGLFFSDTVTVPVGMISGQTITVMAPDGSRTVKASIPNGLGPGDTFLVRLARRREFEQPPSEIHKTQPNFANALEDWLTPIPEAQFNDSSIPTISENVSENHLIECKEEAKDELLHPQEDTNTAECISEQKTNAKSDVPANSTTPRQMQASPQKLLLVQVPPGLVPGQIMHVEVPGEDRTLSVQIPADVDSFHVSYTPRIPTAASEPLNRLSPPETFLRQQSPAGQKLLLVRVPPGTPAGTTLHVSVPDEPGRILAAQVPPGNVSEFHVSYEARVHSLATATGRRGTVHPSNNPHTKSSKEHQKSGNLRQNRNGKEEKEEGANEGQHFFGTNGNLRSDGRDDSDEIRKH